jgi:hypothetical protein
MAAIASLGEPQLDWSALADDCRTSRVTAARVTNAFPFGRLKTGVAVEKLLRAKLAKTKLR